MQTFLPFPSFTESAAALDYKRLGKQRVEVKQLLLALGIPVGEHVPKSSSWRNHPACRMWAGHIVALADYGVRICDEWRDRGYNDTLLPQFEVLVTCDPTYPPWLGYDAFHRSHQSNLKRKDPIYYKSFNVPDNLEYVWPN
jgi:hypothetical protein